jgi:DNA-binding CsgD family transcriptional regulator
MLKPGEFAWANLAEEYQESAKATIARVVTLRENAHIELQNREGLCFRSWLWPLESPEIAICILSINIPKELSLLTDRERETLSLVAQGRSTREIAEELDLSVSTVHTHLRRSRKKLSLPNVESLTGFAARYCHPNIAPKGATET